MKNIIIIVLFVFCFCSSLSAKVITIETSKITSFKTANNRYYIITKTKTFELFSLSQMNAISKLVYCKDSIKVNVKA